jgi:hypothetical protein
VWCRSSNGFHLEPKWRKASVTVASALMLLTLILQGVGDVYWFYCFTTVWCFLFVGSVVYAIQRLHETDSSRLMSSVYVFPVYRWSPVEFGGAANQGIKEDNAGTVSAYLATVMLMVLLPLSWFFLDCFSLIFFFLFF